jgi:hypothetical protein
VRKKRKVKKKTKEGGLSPQEGDVRKSRKEKKKTKEGGLSPQEGDVRKKRKKEKDQERREGGSSKGQVPCALHQEFFFWVTSTWA